VPTSILWYFNGKVRKNEHAVEWTPELHSWDVYLMTLVIYRLFSAEVKGDGMMLNWR
jgi:hypothetical protein